MKKIYLGMGSWFLEAYSVRMSFSAKGTNSMRIIRNYIFNTTTDNMFVSVGILCGAAIKIDIVSGLWSYWMMKVKSLIN